MLAIDVSSGRGDLFQNLLKIDAQCKLDVGF